MPAETLSLADDLVLTRMGYGAMQLAGVATTDRRAAADVLNTALELGIRHIDTAGFYGHNTVNDLIRDVLQPYPSDLRIVTKVGWAREQDGSLHPALTEQDIVDGVRANLDHLGLDTLDVVNLRMGERLSASPASLAEPFEVLAGLQQQGLIRHLGVSNVSAEQVAEAQAIAPIVCVQNQYNLVNRQDEELVDATATQHIAYVPFFPLGGFSPLQSDDLAGIATRLDASPMQVALAWLLHRSPTTLLIPGTTSVAHLGDNAAAARLALPPDVIAELDNLNTTGTNT